MAELERGVNHPDYIVASNGFLSGANATSFLKAV